MSIASPWVPATPSRPRWWDVASTRAHIATMTTAATQVRVVGSTIRGRESSSTNSSSPTNGGTERGGRNRLESSNGSTMTLIGTYCGKTRRPTARMTVSVVRTSSGVLEGAPVSSTDFHAAERRLGTRAGPPDRDFGAPLMVVIPSGRPRSLYGSGPEARLTMRTPEEIPAVQHRAAD